MPDLTIVIDVPTKVGLARIRQRASDLPNRMERENIDFYNKIREGYLVLAKGMPERFVVVDGTQERGDDGEEDLGGGEGPGSTDDEPRAVPWPPALAGTPAVVGDREGHRARAPLAQPAPGGRRPGGPLGDRASQWRTGFLNLGAAAPSPYPPDRHPDCFQMRPAGKSRQISATAVRELVGRINVSSSVSRAQGRRSSTTPTA